MLFLILMAGLGSADKVNVEQVGHFGGHISGVALEHNYAYIGQGKDLVVLDISDVSNPSEVGRVIIPSRVDEVVLSENYAFITGYENGLFVVDITDPSVPKLVGSYDTQGADNIAVSGNYAYIAVGDGLVILDISNPSGPAFAGKYNIGSALDVAVAGNYAYIAGWVTGLSTLNVEKPAEKTSGFGFLLAVSAIGGAFMVLRRMK
ncbi:MAG: LVIVD repeat protein [Methanomethylovorans sp. PtaU1.Bin093]|uniref:LVIVD repeat-containing protein n=1 Tax=Methanomethylovorans sp. PtaU1.Bin093 TaxID=1811679 RepID=UPI0009CF24C5|nr:hypothetical protein [Methanomethylovorans sp. PtaU1.Bin093]OPY19437.1 MAG: LVIVD repeat protein [Methanomethylovorans sp. PtaU1.Bin093]